MLNIIKHHIMLNCEKHRKSNPVWIFLWQTKISESVCKCDWHNVRLFFNMQKFPMLISDSMCNCFYSSFFLTRNVISALHALTVVIYVRAPWEERDSAIRRSCIKTTFILSIQLSVRKYLLFLCYIPRFCSVFI